MGMAETMMPGPHVLVMVGLGGFILLPLVALIVFLLGSQRTVPGNLLELTGAQPTRSRFSTVETLPEPAFIVLADISGYTAFMQGSRFAADHAQYLVLNLLQAVVDAAEPTLKFLKVEGDAVLFIREGAEPGRTGQAISAVLTDMAAAFQVERRSLRTMNNCPCRACAHVDQLDIKFVVDFGEIGLFSVDGRPDASGTTLICAHRLLKAEHGPGHLLISDPASTHVPAPWGAKLEARHYDLEGLGSVTAHFAPVPAHLASFSHLAARPNPSLARKLAFNLRRTLKHLTTRARPRAT